MVSLQLGVAGYRERSDEAGTFALKMVPNSSYDHDALVIFEYPGWDYDSVKTVVVQASPHRVAGDTCR